MRIRNWYYIVMFKNRALTTLTVINSLFSMAGLALVPIYAVFLEGIGATVFIISLLAALELGSKLIGTFILRFIGDGYKEKEYMIIISYLFRAVAWGSLCFVAAITPLFLIQILLGLGDAIGSPSFSAVFAAHLDKGKQIAEYSDYTLTKNLFGIIGTVGGGVIVTTFGFTYLFALMSFIALFCAFYIFIQPRKLL